MCQNWILAAVRERKVVRVDFVASQWVGSLSQCRATMSWKMKAEGQHGTLGKDWASSHCRSQFQICDHLLPMTPCILYLTLSSLSFLIFKNRNNKTCCPSLIINQCEHSRSIPVANKSRFINPLSRGKAHTREPGHVSPTKGKIDLL